MVAGVPLALGGLLLIIATRGGWVRVTGGHLTAAQDRTRAPHGDQGPQATRKLGDPAKATRNRPEMDGSHMGHGPRHNDLPSAHMRPHGYRMVAPRSDSDKRIFIKVRIPRPTAAGQWASAGMIIAPKSTKRRGAGLSHRWPIMLKHLPCPQSGTPDVGLISMCYTALSAGNVLGGGS
jgi:hypothetical protein